MVVVKSRPWRKQQHMASQHMHKGKKSDLMECSGEQQVFQETKICDNGGGVGVGVGLGRQHKMIKVAWATS